MTGARWFQTSDRHVAKTDFGDVRVSTVFLGFDRSFGQGPPLLFETMIFGGFSIRINTRNGVQPGKRLKRSTPRLSKSRDSRSTGLVPEWRSRAGCRRASRLDG